MIMIARLKSQTDSFIKSNGGITEISNQSLVINSITGINREDHKLYYPKEMILKLKIIKLKVLLLTYLMN